MKKNLPLSALGVSLVLVVIMLALLATPGLTAKVGNSVSNTTLVDLINPSNGNGLGGTIAALIFTVLAAAIVLALCVLALVKKNIKIAPLCALCGALLLFVAAILFFCTRSFYFGAVAKETGISVSSVKDTFGDSVKLGAGAAVNGIFGLLAAFGLGCYGVLTWKK